MVEVEERRRAWWALVILDRFVSIGCPGRPFMTADPNINDVLPADDAEWDEGAARLLGQVLHCLTQDPASQFEVWQQLDRTLHSMLTAALNIDCPDYDQITFIYSSIVALYSPWISTNANEEFDNGFSQRARTIIQQITDRISENLIERQCFLGRDPENISPWGLYFAYQVCGAHMRSSRPTKQQTEVINSLREGLIAIDERWGVAGVYLQLLEAQEAIRQTM
ncbi:hypothetical protein N7454_007693 [Penicillium verhagenii]|nr:hypothetical protein N7454_007693 [Penicillium verhagenii]